MVEFFDGAAGATKVSRLSDLFRALIQDETDFGSSALIQQKLSKENQYARYAIAVQAIVIVQEVLHAAVL
jgi:hypothetical protein